MNLISFIQQEAEDMGVAFPPAKHILVKQKVLTQVSVKEYAKEQDITEAKARTTLNKMVEDGDALVDSNVIIGSRISKKTGRGSSVPVYGNLYTIKNGS